MGSVCSSSVCEYDHALIADYTTRSHMYVSGYFIAWCPTKINRKNTNYCSHPNGNENKVTYSTDNFFNNTKKTFCHPITELPSPSEELDPELLMQQQKPFHPPSPHNRERPEHPKRHLLGHLTHILSYAPNRQMRSYCPTIMSLSWRDFSNTYEMRMTSQLSWVTKRLTISPGTREKGYPAVCSSIYSLDARSFWTRAGFCILYFYQLRRCFMICPIRGIMRLRRITLVCNLRQRRVMIRRRRRGFLVRWRRGIRRCPLRQNLFRRILRKYCMMWCMPLKLWGCRYYTWVMVVDRFVVLYLMYTLLTIVSLEWMHPSYDTRLSNFDKWLPEALDKYNEDGGYKCQRIRNEMKLARKHAAALASKREEKLRNRQ